MSFKEWLSSYRGVHALLYALTSCLCSVCVCMCVCVREEESDSSGPFSYITVEKVSFKAFSAFISDG